MNDVTRIHQRPRNQRQIPFDSPEGSGGGLREQVRAHARQARRAHERCERAVNAREEIENRQQRGGQ